MSSSINQRSLYIVASGLW